MYVKGNSARVLILEALKAVLKEKQYTVDKISGRGGYKSEDAMDE